MITQTIRLLKNTPTIVSFNIDALFAGMEIYILTPLPAWFIPFGLEPYLTVSLITAPATGTYTYYFDSGGSPFNQDACLIIEVVDDLFTSLPTCSDSSTVTLIWITREGGRASYIFDQRKDYSTTIGESKIFDNGSEIKYIYRGKNFDTKNVYKTGLSNNEVDLIESLRYSIQAWEYNNDTDVSTSIVLKSDSFAKYNTKNKLNEISLSYRIAAYKEIQNQ